MFESLTKYNHEKHLRANKFHILVLAQIGVLILPALGQLWQFEFFLQASYTIVLLASVYIVTFSKKDLRIGIILCSLSVVFVWIEVLGDENGYLHLFHLFSALTFFIFSALKLWGYMYRQKKFSANMLFGAVAGYFYIGFVGAMVFSILEIIFPESYRLSEDAAIFDMLYLSFVTISTLGYGDLVPISHLAKSITVLFAMAGQLYLTIILAIIVGQFLKDSDQE